MPVDASPGAADASCTTVMTASKVDANDLISTWAVGGVASTEKALGGIYST
jgi:hypothetical protein